MRKWIAVIAGASVLLAVNFSIYQREQLLSEGRVVLLELAPVDPRSLMQGDYMALRFKVADESLGNKTNTPLHDGHIVVTLDPNNVGHFTRMDDGAPTAAQEVRLRYRIRNDQAKFATNAFFFQEGHAQQYEVARYGEFRVAKNGDMILTAMRGADLKTLGLSTP